MHYVKWPALKVPNSQHWTEYWGEGERHRTHGYLKIHQHWGWSWQCWWQISQCGTLKTLLWKSPSDQQSHWRQDNQIKVEPLRSENTFDYQSYCSKSPFLIVKLLHHCCLSQFKSQVFDTACSTVQLSKKRHKSHRRITSNLKGSHTSQWKAAYKQLSPQWVRVQLFLATTK